MKELKHIKDHYGEDFMHYCRNNFSTILQHEGLLQGIITSSFADTKSLFEDIKGYENYFNDFINENYNRLISKDEEDINDGKTDISPEDLMLKAGYILHPECVSEEDIQSFRFLYMRDDEKAVEYKRNQDIEHCDGEELCTFNGGRLNYCRVWFATKNDIDDIKRIDYPLPGEDFSNVGGRSFDQVKDEYARYKFGDNVRWDDLTLAQQNIALRDNRYATSVISIQFSKGNINSLSIKNRYNHRLPKEINPDATYGNNLDNIEKGLNNSFNKTYELNNNEVGNFDMPHYVMAEDGKRYRYNSEENNIYYCENNKIIDNGKLVEYDPSKYIVTDNGLIIDLQGKKVFPYDKKAEESFHTTIPEMDLGDKRNKITVSLDKSTKARIVSFITPNHEDIVLTLDKHNCITAIEDPNLIKAPDNYCRSLPMLKEIYIPNIKKMGNRCLERVYSLTNFRSETLISMGDKCFNFAESLATFDVSSLTVMGKECINIVDRLESFRALSLKEMKDDCLYSAKELKSLEIPNVESIGNNCLCHIDNLGSLSLKSLKKTGEDCFVNAYGLKEVDLSNLEIMGNGCLRFVDDLRSLNLEKAKEIGDGCMERADQLKEINVPNLKEIGDNSLCCVNSLERFESPNLRKMGSYCLNTANKLESFISNELRIMKDDCLSNADNLKEVEVPKACFIGSNSLNNAEGIENSNSHRGSFIVQAIKDQCLKLASKLGFNKHNADEQCDDVEAQEDSNN